MMDRQELRELRGRSESDPEEAVARKETLYEPFAPDEESRSFFGDDRSGPQNIAAEALENLVDYSEDVAVEIVEKLFDGEFVWNDRTVTLASAIHERYPEVLETRLEEEIRALKQADRREQRTHLDVLENVAAVDPTLLSPYLDDLAALLDVDNRTTPRQTLGVFEALLDARTQDAEPIATLVSDYLSSTDGENARTKRAFRVLSNLPTSAIPASEPALTIAFDELADPTTNTGLYISRYLGLAGIHDSERIAPKLLDVIDDAESAEVAKHTLRALQTTVDDGGGIPSGRMTVLLDQLPHYDEEVVWGAVAVLKALGDREPERIAANASALVDCLDRAVDGEFAHSTESNPRKGIRDIEQGSLENNLLLALTAAANVDPDATADAIPLAVRELADADPMVDFSASFSEQLEQNVEEGPPPRQFLQAVVESHPRTVFDELLEQRRARGDLNAHEARVLVRAGEEDPSYAAEHVDDLLTLLAPDEIDLSSIAPLPLLLQEIARNSPKAVANEETVARVMSLLGESETFATAVSFALMNVDIDYLEGHFETLGEYVRKRVGLPNTLLLLVRGDRAGMAGASSTLRSLTDTLFDLLDHDEEGVRFAASAGLRPAAEENPTVFEGVMPLLTVRLEDGADNVVTAVLELFAVLAPEYANELSVTRERVTALLDDATAEEAVYASTILAAVGEETDISTLEAVRSRWDDETVLDAIDTAIDAIEERAADSEEPSSSDESKASETAESAPRYESRIPQETPDVVPASFELESRPDRDPVATGATAAVYAISIADEVYALKVPREGSLPPGMRSQYVDEAEVWSELDDHDHIISVLDYGERPIGWILLEYADGGSLDQRLDDIGPAEGLYIGICLAEAIGYVSQHGVAHGDIKPGNVLFRKTPDGSWDVPKLSDWGLAQIVMKNSGSDMGFDPRYGAPEHWDPDLYGEVDWKTDQYQLARTLYRVLTNEPLFDGNPGQVMRKTLDEDPRAPSEINSAIPERIDEILLKALQRRKEARYDSMYYFRDELQDVFDSLTNGR